MLDIVQNVAPLKATETTGRQLSWLSERIEKGRLKPFMEIVAITPEIAQRMLELNDGNRPINERLVGEIAADIEGGRWTLNGESIILSEEGFLNDGQHRLEAVLRTQTPIQSAVVFGVPRKGRMTVDMGRQRSAGSFLAMDGATRSNNAAAIARLLILYERGSYSYGTYTKRLPSSPPTKQEILGYYSRHRKAIISAMDTLANEQFTRVAGLTPLAVAHVILHRVNAAECAVFFARLLDGANLKQHDPILWLRSRFVAERKHRLKTYEKLEIILLHWNRFRTGAKLTRHIPRQGAYPKVMK